MSEPLRPPPVRAVPARAASASASALPPALPDAAGALLGLLAGVVPEGAPLAPAHPRERESQDERQHEESENPAQAERERQRMDACVRHIAHLVGRVEPRTRGQDSWNARIPLDAELLPDTVLHLGFSPALVTLHFQTHDWTVRGLLQPRLRALEQLIAAIVPDGCDVVVSV